MKNKAAKGAPLKSKSTQFLVHLLFLLLAFLLPQNTYADSSAEIRSERITQTDKDEIRKFHLAIMYSADSTLHSKIAERLPRLLTATNIQITTITESSNNLHESDRPDLIVVIGSKNIKKANQQFATTDKLIIVAYPGDYRQDSLNASQTAILYMTQPYCRQIQFIRQLNDRWQTISYFSDKNKPINDSLLKQCAAKYGLKTYPVSVTDTNRLTDDLKTALNHSDLILAFPDKDIFNRNTVKNILLTSYRYRKPVIAFSRNFVTAGALASIHSDVDQISISTSTLIEQYLANDHRFTESVNYPLSFDIDINEQVFKALDINIPDIEKIKQVIENRLPENTRSIL
jgi:putative ABC transport system substrate-binding protein